MQRILQEHQQQMHTIEKDKKQIEEEKEKQRLAEEDRRSSQVEERVQTGQSSAPPPSPAAAVSPVGSTGLLEETPLATRPASVTSGGSNVAGPTEPVQPSPGDNVLDQNDQVTEDSAPPPRENLDGSESRPRSRSDVQHQRSVSPRTGASPKEDLGKRARTSSLKKAPNVKSKSRTPSPREGGTGKRSSSAKD